MIRVGAYDIARKSPDINKFLLGLVLLRRIFDLNYAVFPCSIDEQILYAEWVDNDGDVVWSTRSQNPKIPVLDRGGQVALSNVPDVVKSLENGQFARYGKFGFDPDQEMPKPFPAALCFLA